MVNFATYNTGLDLGLHPDSTNFCPFVGRYGSIITSRDLTIIFTRGYILLTHILTVKYSKIKPFFLYRYIHVHTYTFNIYLYLYLYILFYQKDSHSFQQSTQQEVK